MRSSTRRSPPSHGVAVHAERGRRRRRACRGAPGRRPGWSGASRPRATVRRAGRAPGGRSAAAAPSGRRSGSPASRRSSRPTAPITVVVGGRRARARCGRWHGGGSSRGCAPAPRPARPPGPSAGEGAGARRCRRRAPPRARRRVRRPPTGPLVVEPPTAPAPRASRRDQLQPPRVGGGHRRRRDAHARRVDNGGSRRGRGWRMRARGTANRCERGARRRQPRVQQRLRWFGLTAQGEVDGSIAGGARGQCAGATQPRRASPSRRPRWPRSRSRCAPPRPTGHPAKARRGDRRAGR